MAMRLRRVEGRLIALCAAETDEKPGDVYLDDEQHYAIAQKAWDDLKLDDGTAPVPDADPERQRLAASQKVRDAQEELARFLSLT